MDALWCREGAVGCGDVLDATVGSHGHGEDDIANGDVTGGVETRGCGHLKVLRADRKRKMRAEDGKD